MSDQTEKAKKPAQQPTLTKAEIRAQKALRLELCAQAIQAALSYYECDLVAIPTVSGGKIDAKTELVLK